jgi:trimeric autotransporter adhesin
LNKGKINMKLQNSIHILIGTVCIGLLPRMQAVVPGPDGGYPNFTTAEGTKALQSLTTGAANTAVGWLSLTTVTTGSFNTGVGAGTLVLNTGDDNTAIGAAALFSNTTGGDNTATGDLALFNNTTGDFNTANGVNALQNNTIGNQNTANGVSALYSNTTGIRNTATGSFALENNSSGNNNIALGVDAGSNVSTANNVICIGTAGNNVDNSCYIGNIFNATSSGGTAVFVNSNGRLGTATPSRRFKEEIKPMEGASEALFALKPVAFRYKKDIDPAGTPQLGLVAEEVERVNPDLVVRDKEGKPYSVRYDQVNATLLNEFLKAHRKMEAQQKQIDDLTARLDQQAAQIQKVNAQLEASKPAPQVLNDP